MLSNVFTILHGILMDKPKLMFRYLCNNYFAMYRFSKVPFFSPLKKFNMTEMMCTLCIDRLERMYSVF
uniref:Cyclic-AMP response element binding protein B at 17A n=1 Tax=Pararge aegeria TaxID=116150 RepID=S4P9B4_9NEOP